MLGNALLWPRAFCLGWLLLATAASQDTCRTYITSCPSPHVASSSSSTQQQRMMICCSQVDAEFLNQQEGPFQQRLRITCLESRYAKGVEDGSLDSAKHTGLCGRGWSLAWTCMTQSLTACSRIASRACALKISASACSTPMHDGLCEMKQMQR